MAVNGLSKSFSFKFPGVGLVIFTDMDQRSIFLGFEFRKFVFFWVLVTAAVFFWVVK